jgi:MFS family permease
MAVPTVLIGCLPTYKTAGILASCLLVLLRFLQGLSLGGEVPGAVVFIAESVAQKHRGLATGLILFGVNMGMLAGSYMGAHLTHILSVQQLVAWGWRIPFWFGGLLGILSYYLRKKMQETPIFNVLTHQSKVIYPIKEIFLKHRMKFFQGAAIVALEVVVISIIFLFMPTYLSTFFHFSLEKMLALNTVNIMAFSIPVLFASFLSDLLGRKKIMMFGASFFVFFSYPIFLLFGYHSYWLAVLALSIFALFSSCIAGVFPSMMAELFPTQIRYTGVVLCYNFGFRIVGGLTPLLVMVFIHWSGNPFAARMNSKLSLLQLGMQRVPR